MRIEHNIKKVAKRIDKLAGEVTNKMQAGMVRALSSIGRIGAQDWLQGPKPEKLNIFKGKLIRAMIGSHGFGGGIKATGAVSISSKGGWIKAEKVGRFIRGEIGVDVQSPEGFDYPEYWEFRGSKHGGPRPFLNPAGLQAQSSGLLDRDIQKELNKVKLD